MIADPFAAIITALTHSGFKAAKPLKRSIWAPWILRDPPTPEALQEVAESGGAIEALQCVPAVGAELEELARQGIWTLTCLHTEYPGRWRERLGHRAPPVVFGMGDPAHLRQPALAIVGSREAAETALEFAKACAVEGCRRGFSVVSGGARGVDMAAHRAAIESGGSTVAICADAFPVVHRRLESTRAVLLTPYHPLSGFTVGQAMGRNKLIYAMAERALVAACDRPSGGTWTGAIEALEARWLPIGIGLAQQVSDAPRHLIQKGGQAVSHPEQLFEIELGPEVPSLFD